MYFIHIATYTHAEDFTSWLDGKNKLAFNDSMEFKEWLAGQRVFPLELYISGTVIRLTSEEQVDCFRLGFETAMDMRVK